MLVKVRLPRNLSVAGTVTMSIPDVLTTGQLAQKLNLSPASLRNYKSRFKDQLVEGVHFVKDENGNTTLWTLQGEAQLRFLLDRGTGISDPSAAAGAAESVFSVESALPGMAERTPGLTLQNLIDDLAEEFVWQRIEAELPTAIAQVIDRIASRHHPADLERLAILGATVLPPRLQSTVNGSLPLLQQSYEIFGGYPPED